MRERQQSGFATSVGSLRRRTAALVAVATLVATACGSTVPVAGPAAGVPTTTADGTVVDPGTGLALPDDAAPLGSSSTPDRQAGEQPATDAGGNGSGSVHGGGGAGTASSGAGAPAAAPDAGTAARRAPAGGATGPVRLGFLNTKVGNAEAFGIEMGQNYSPREVFEALVRVLNEKGGLGGRKIVPVIADTDTASQSWASDYQAACERFTRDDEVVAVLGYSFALIEGFEACLTKAGVAHINAGYDVGDVATYRQHPFFTGTNITADRRYRLQIEGAMRSGFLERSNKLGLLLDDCPHNARAYARTAEPYIASHKLQVASTYTLSCAQGAGDVGTVVNQIQNAVLQFRSEGVDRVFAEGVPVVVFAHAAESQGYRPGYVVTSTTGGGALEPNIPAAQAANVHGSGWLPAVDVNRQQAPRHTGPQRRCLRMLASEGIKPTQFNDFLNAYTSCDSLFLYEAAMKLTNGSTDPAQITRAIESMGGSYRSASSLEAGAAFARGKRDAPDRYRIWRWNATCSCFQYRGRSARIS